MTPPLEPTLAGSLGPIGILWLVILLVGLPLASRPRLHDPTAIPRKVLYQAAMWPLWLLSLGTLLVVYLEGLPLKGLFLRGLPSLGFFALTAGTYVLAVVTLLGLVALQIRCGGREPALVHHLMPRTRGEKEWFVAVSLTAGLCEEWLYRGYCLAALGMLTGSLPVAAGVQAVSFGAAHAYQSRWGLGRAVLAGMIFAVPPLWFGSFWPSATAHFLVDASAGLWFWPWLRRLVPYDGEEADDASQESTR